MSDKSFKVKSGLQIPGVTSANILTTDSSGNVSSAPTLAIANGGTGQTSANNALNALLPIQSGSTINYALESDGTNTSWQKLYNQTIQNNGTTVMPRGTLNVLGGTFADSSLNDTTTLTIPTGVSIDGGSTITASSASVKPLIIKATASQTANLQEWQDSAGTVLAGIGPNGRIYAQGKAGNTDDLLYLRRADNGVIFYVDKDAALRGNFSIRVNQEPTIDTQAYIWSGTAARSALGVSGTTSSAPTFYVKGTASQTSNLQEWQNSSGTVLTSISSGGNLVVGATGTLISYASGRGIFALGDPASVGLTVKAAASQTANVFEVQNSGGSAHIYVDAYGRFVAQSSGLTVKTGYSSGVGLLVDGYASQTADLQQWRNSAGTVLAKVNSAGALTVPSATIAYVNFYSNGNTSFGGTTQTYNLTAGSSTSVGTFTVTPTSASTIGAVIRGAASQSASLQEWQNSSGTMLASITDTGFSTAILKIPYIYTYGIQGWNGVGGSIEFANATPITIKPQSASVVNLVIKGAASQTANLQEWQNSAGTVLAKVDASGSLTVQDLTVNGTTTTINSTTLTVDDKNIELASVASPTDTTADGAGITIKGATDKTFSWVQSTAAFTSSEPISAPAFKSAGTAVSSNITLVSGYRYFVDTTSARTLTLPSIPSVGDEIQIYDASNSALTNNITVASNSNKIQGSVQDLIIDSNAATVYLTYTGSTYGWAVN